MKKYVEYMRGNKKKYSTLLIINMYKREFKKYNEANTTSNKVHRKIVEYFRA